MGFNPPPVSGGGGTQAWQFKPESYGAKRDGKILYDASVTNGSAVLTAAGLPAPAAPTVNNSGTGGTVLAGVYKIGVTYVNQYGETVGSAQTSTTTSGSTSTITVTSPLPWTNATAYYVYCSQAGGSTLTRQQAPGSPTPLRTSYVITAPPTSSGANPPVSNTSNSAPFTSADVGKHIVIPSAGGFTNVPLSTTILSYQSATQVTLAANATVSGGGSLTGSGAFYGTDDTSAVQSAINAAVAYAQTAGSEQAIGEVVFSDGIYIISGAPGTGSQWDNGQLHIPFVDPYAGPKVNLKLTGIMEASGPAHWEQPNPPASGAVLCSTYYNDSGTPMTPNQCVLGGPVENTSVTPNQFTGGNGGLFSNMRVIVDGINILVPYRCSINGLDLYGTGQADIKSFSYFAMARTLGASAGGWPPYIGGSSNPSPWSTIGYRGPTTGNNAQNDAENITVYGPNWGLYVTDHFSAVSVKCIFTNAAVTIGGNGNGHHCWIGSLCSEQTSIPLYSDGTSGVAITVDSMHVENSDFLISDPSSKLYGVVRAEISSVGGPAAYFAGGVNVGGFIKLIYDWNAPGPVSSPQAPPASTVAWPNHYWIDAEITLSVSGGTLSALTITGASAVAQVIPASTTFYRFTLPSGASYTPTFTGALTHTVTLL